MLCCQCDELLKMGQHGGTGHRPVFAIRFVLLLFSLLLSSFRSSSIRTPQIAMLVHFNLFSTLLTPPTGTINCFPTAQLPTQATRPFRAFPVTHRSIPIVPKPSLPQLSGRRPFAVDLLFGFSPSPILWQTWLDQLSETGPQVSPPTNL